MSLLKTTEGPRVGGRRLAVVGFGLVDWRVRNSAIRRVGRSRKLADEAGWRSRICKTAAA
jgi:hypothetical protein